MSDLPAPPNVPPGFSEAAAGLDAARYVLRLWVTGLTPRSLNAIEQARHLCETHLKGRYDLEIIDLASNPQLAAADNIIGVPTLVKSLPSPLRRLIGDLSDEERVLVGLDLHTNPGAPAATGG